MRNFAPAMDGVRVPSCHATKKEAAQPDRCAALAIEDPPGRKIEKGQKMRLGAAIGATVLMLAVTAVGSMAAKGPPEADASGGPPFDLSDESRIQAGKRTFESTCAQYCHGYEPPLFIGRTDLEPEYVFNTIRDGGKGATPMPPWGDVFTPEEIWELVAYVKSLGEW